MVDSSIQPIKLETDCRRYGVKAEALALLQEWVRDVGSSAGLNSSNTQILSGAVGCPESRLEVRTCCISDAITKRVNGAREGEAHHLSAV